MRITVSNSNGSFFFDGTASDFSASKVVDLWKDWLRMVEPLDPAALAKLVEQAKANAAALQVNVEKLSDVTDHS